LVFGSSPAYVFSKPLNWLDYDPSYPRNPSTLGEYIRKYRKDEGISQVELAKAIDVNEMTIVNWEIRDKMPRIKAVKERLARTIPGTEGFL
jgi:DNA-binding XRE family transcriptional regulator